MAAEEQDQEAESEEALPVYVKAARPHFAESATFHYVKSPQFRTIHADGAIGGVTPRKYIHYAIYSERAAIPRVAEAEIVDGAATGKSATVETRVGYVRELEVDLMLDLGAAKALARPC
jgi:hypothetical protein